jgi:aldehyde dehydrogenase (NAD+)
MTQDIHAMVTQLHQYVAAHHTKPIAYRQKQLAGLERFVRECEADIEAALQQDLAKPAIESYVTEISQIRSEIKIAQKNLAAWMKPKRVATHKALWPGKSQIISEPYGVVLIISPWNYPVLLTLVPLIGAIAAGNAVVLKPSEVAPATSRLLAEKLPRYLDSNSVQIVEGGVAETTALLAEQFDYLFYTGNGVVGRIVMEAAAKHLTPLTLELGGKSPCIVDRDANLDVAARRIAWGKFTNAGQTCIAPDYLLVHKEIETELLTRLKKYVREFYGDDPAASANYGRIINANHHRRLMKLLNDSGEIIIGGTGDEQTKYIAPTIIRQVSESASVMQEEIFGPILPVLTVDNMQQAIQFVNKRPKPFALYVFSKDENNHRDFIEQTSSGGVCLNHVMLQIAVPTLPFGGVGPSGMGAYHGKTSFDTFSHRKSVFTKPSWFDPSIMYPPYHTFLKKLLSWLI